jgi:hypothetical protein
LQKSVVQCTFNVVLSSFVSTYRHFSQLAHLLIYQIQQQTFLKQLFQEDLMIRRTILTLVSAGLLSMTFADNDSAETSINIDDSQKSEHISRFGGAGGVEFGLMYLDLEPIKKISKELVHQGFDFSDGTAPVIGMTGYFGQYESGIRIGGGAWVAYKAFTGDKWISPADSTTLRTKPNATVDSIVNLHVLHINSGFLVEKSFQITKNFECFAGGLIGGGVIMAIEDRKLYNGAFTNVTISDDDYNDSASNVQIAAAPFWSMDIHGGASYSFTKWMHLGLNGALNFNYSTSGFQATNGIFSSKNDSFWTFNPALKVRLVFGSKV